MIARNLALFEEFDVAASLRIWIWLYPIPMLLCLISMTSLRFLVMRAGLATAFLVPGMVSAFRTRARFETAGTDRVDTLQKAADHAVLAGIIGLLVVLSYTVILCAFAVTRDTPPSMP